MAVATFPKPFIITDAAINIRPTLEDKRDIVQNAIDLMHMIREDTQVRVAVLSVVETVTSVIPTTLDAAALSQMVDRGQITNAIVDGPLAFDNAICRADPMDMRIISCVLASFIYNHTKAKLHIQAGK